MNVIETIGAVVGLAYLYFEYKASIWTWVFGVLMPIAYVYIFFTTGLYANASLNVYYIIASFYGFFVWRKAGARATGPTRIESCPRRYWLLLVLVVVVIAEGLTLLLMQLNESQFPLLDGFSASLSVVMMFMLSKRWYQQWICCIVTEPVMIVMSLLSGLYATAAMYVVYLVVAIMGYVKWRREYLKQSAEAEVPTNNATHIQS